MFFVMKEKTIIFGFSGKCGRHFPQKYLIFAENRKKDDFAAKRDLSLGHSFSVLMKVLRTTHISFEARRWKLLQTDSYLDRRNVFQLAAACFPKYRFFNHS